MQEPACRPAFHGGGPAGPSRTHPSSLPQFCTVVPHLSTLFAGSVTSRTRLTSRLDAGTGRRQLKVQDLLAALRVRIPRDGLCVVALTMCDLYEARSVHRNTFNFWASHWSRHVGQKLLSHPQV